MRLHGVLPAAAGYDLRGAATSRPTHGRYASSLPCRRALLKFLQDKSPIILIICWAFTRSLRFRSGRKIMRCSSAAYPKLVCMQELAFNSITYNPSSLTSSQAMHRQVNSTAPGSADRRQVSCVKFGQTSNRRPHANERACNRICRLSSGGAAQLEVFSDAKVQGMASVPYPTLLNTARALRSLFRSPYRAASWRWLRLTCPARLGCAPAAASASNAAALPGECVRRTWQA